MNPTPPWTSPSSPRGPRMDAADRRLDCDDHKAYYQGATPIAIRVTGDRNRGRLLGAQLVGVARQTGTPAVSSRAASRASAWGSSR